jgi:hypothetical protein
VDGEETRFVALRESFKSRVKSVEIDILALVLTLTTVLDHNSHEPNHDDHPQSQEYFLFLGEPGLGLLLAPGGHPVSFGGGQFGLPDAAKLGGKRCL